MWNDIFTILMINEKLRQATVGSPDQSVTINHASWEMSVAHIGKKKSLLICECIQVMRTVTLVNWQRMNITSHTQPEFHSFMSHQ